MLLLFIGFDYTIETNAVIYYIDTGESGGETDFLSSSGYSGAFPSDVLHDRTVELMIAFYGSGSVYVYDVYDGGSTDITSYSGVNEARSSYSEDGSAGSVEVGIPWNRVYGLGAGAVPPGETIHIGGIIRAGDDGMPADMNPDGDGNYLWDYYDVSIDDDEDGVPDEEWSPGPNYHVTTTHYYIKINEAMFNPTAESNE